jgi:hypothetical protein
MIAADKGEHGYWAQVAGLLPFSCAPMMIRAGRGKPYPQTSCTWQMRAWAASLPR